MPKREVAGRLDALNGGMLNFLSGPSTLSPFLLADSSHPPRFCSNSILSEKLSQVHASRMHLQQRRARHTYFLSPSPITSPITFCLASLMSGYLTRPPIIRCAPKTRAHSDSSQCLLPSPLVLSILQVLLISRCSASAGTRGGFVEVSAVLAMSHPQSLEHGHCLFAASSVTSE